MNATSRCQRTKATAARRNAREPPQTLQSRRTIDAVERRPEPLVLQGIATVRPFLALRLPREPTSVSWHHRDSDKQKAKDIEAKERTKILEGRHGIRRQPDITFRAFAETYV